jgi:hypothetical protein
MDGRALLEAWPQACGSPSSRSKKSQKETQSPRQRSHVGSLDPRVRTHVRRLARVGIPLPTNHVPAETVRQARANDPQVQGRDPCRCHAREPRGPAGRDRRLGREWSPAGPVRGSGRDPIQLVERVAQPLARGTLGAVWPYLLVVVTDKAGACAALGLWAGCGTASCAAGSGSQLAESARGHRAGTLGIPSRTCSSASGSATLTSTACARTSLRLRDVYRIREHS